MKRRPPLGERNRRLLELWHERRAEQRTEHDLLRFYGWLADRESSLIPDGPGSFQNLRALLRDYVRDAATSREPLCHDTESQPRDDADSGTQD